MTDWPVKTLGEVCDFVSGSVTPKSGVEYQVFSVPSFDYGNPELLDGSEIKSSKRPVEPGDVLLCKINPRINRVWRVDRESKNQQIASTEWITLRCRENILATFLQYVLQAPSARTAMIESVTGATGSHTRAKFEIVEELEFSVPPLDEQKRIVELLDAATTRVSELTECYEQARTYANNLFASALRETLESNPDWPIKTLGEVALVNPSEPALSEDAPFVPMDAVTAGIRDIQYTQPRGQRSGARARAGDILFARITPCLQNGKVALVQDEIARCGGSTEFIVVRAGSEVLNGFLYQWITSDHIRDEVTALMKGATGRQRLNAEDLALTELPIPSLDEQKRLVMRLESMKAKTSEMVAAYDAKLTAAKNLRQSILEAAFAGEM